MPIYVEMVKDKKTGKRIENKIDGQKRYFIKTYVTDSSGKKTQITRRNKEWLGRDGYRKAQQEEIRLINKTVVDKVNNTIVKSVITNFINYKKDKIKYSSIKKYTDDIHAYINNYFPILKKANTITTNDIVEWMNKINNLNLAISTKKRLYTLLSSIFKYGCTYHGLEKNVVKLVENFKDIKGNKKEMNFLTQKEFESFVEYEKNNLYKDFFSVLFFTGMRRGELLALSSNDINYEENTIKISKTYNPKLEKFDKALSVPKTNKSNRTILMIKNVREILKKYNSCNDRIFKKITLTTLQRKCDINCKKANINKKIRIHDFRHSFASMCIDKEVPIGVISEYLGHENISITLDIYSHLYPNSQYKLIDRFK